MKHHWVENVLVGSDGSMITVDPDGRMKIRWAKTKDEYFDKPRVCNLGNETRARRVAETIFNILGI